VLGQTSDANLLPVIWVAAAAVYSGCSRAEEVRVPRRQPHDFVFHSPTERDNPFTVRFSATVTGANGRSFQTLGFYDGEGGPQDKTYRVAQSAEEVCRRAWEICMAGGYAVYYYTYTAWDVIRADDAPPGYSYFRHLREFFERTRYWRMKPCDRLVNEGYCLADPGREYVVFLKTARPFVLRIEGCRGRSRRSGMNLLQVKGRLPGNCGTGRSN